MLTKRITLAILFILFTGGVAAQSATIQDVADSKTVTVGQTFSAQINYRTESMESCVLGFVDSSLPRGWEGSGERNIDTTGGSTATAATPKVTAQRATESDVRLELECSSGSQSQTDTSSFLVVAEDPPFLDANLETENTLTVSEGENYSIRFSVSNSGSSRTEAARAAISTPSGFDNPSSIKLKEAGQNQGVIRPDRSTGTYSFDLRPQQGFSEGILSIDFTSSEIGTTDTIQVDLNKPDTPDEENDDSGDDADTGPGGGGSFTPPVESENQSQEPKQNNSSDQTQKAVRKVQENFVQVEKNVPDAAQSVQFEVDPQAERTSVRNIELELIDSEQVSVSVRNLTEGQSEQIPSPSNFSNVYSYQEINTSLDNSNIDTVEIEFSVSSQWLETQSANPEDVGMIKRSTSSWKTLPTSYINSTEAVHNFRATSESFSTYAIAIKQSEDSQDPSVPQNRTETNPKQTKDPGNIYHIFAAVVVLIFVISVAVAFHISNGAWNVEGENSEKQELADSMNEIKQSLHRNDITDEQRQQIMALIQRAALLMDKEQYNQAVQAISEADDIIQRNE